MEHTATPPRRVQVFVVDNDPAMLTLYGRIMTFEGHDPVLFTDPAPALNALASKISADLLITELNLGADMTGHDLARAARLIRPGLPVVMVTGVADVPDRPDVSARLPKPFRVQELTATVARCLAA